MRTWSRLVKVVVLTAALGVVSACGPSLVSTIAMRCGEAQVHTVKVDRCVKIVKDDGGPCPVKVTVQCEGEAEKSTTVKGGSDPGKLCCRAALGQVRFEAQEGNASGKCTFEYSRSD